MKENTRVRVNHDFILIVQGWSVELKKPYGLVKLVDSYGVKVKLDRYPGEAIYFEESDLQVIK